MDITTRITDLAATAAEASGLVIDSVKVSAAGSRSKVLVTVDLPETEVGSADLDRVADASRRIGAALDEADVPSTPYVLEVSTPGTDRTLTERRHFLRARTRLIKVVAAQGTTTGRLTEVDGDTLVLDVDGARTEIPLSSVASAHVVVELKPLD